ncbi:MAG: hypothetical protein GC186_17055 [Rhodobacteraceae bacterium]|nr:hypothetical protein [Paracoccaceae bacterium]
MPDSFTLYVHDEATARATSLDDLSFLRLPATAKGVSGQAFLDSWAGIKQAIDAILADSKPSADKGLKLSEIDVGLTVSGSGHVIFADAKAEASLTLKWTRG